MDKGLVSLKKELMQLCKDYPVKMITAKSPIQTTRAEEEAKLVKNKSILAFDIETVGILTKPMFSLIPSKDMGSCPMELHNRIDYGFGVRTKFSEDDALTALGFNPRILYETKQTREMCEQAIRNKPEALQYVIEQDEDLCMRAIEMRPHTFKFVRRQTKALCIQAVTSHPDNLNLVLKQDDDICMAAIKRDLSTMKYVRIPLLQSSLVEIDLLYGNAILKDTSYKLLFTKLEIWTKNNEEK